MSEQQGYFPPQTNAIIRAAENRGEYGTEQQGYFPPEVNATIRALESNGSTSTSSGADVHMLKPLLMFLFFFLTPCMVVVYGAFFLTFGLSKLFYLPAEYFGWIFGFISTVLIVVALFLVVAFFRHSTRATRKAYKEKGIKFKSARIAVFLSFFIGFLGIGCFYLGYTRKGINHIILSATLTPIAGFIWGLVDVKHILDGQMDEDVHGLSII